MMMKPASASGCEEGSTRSADSGAEPRGSNSTSRRSQSPSRSSQRILSSIVSPGTSSTPPTMIRLGSPSAWASTQWMTLAIRIGGTLTRIVGRVSGRLEGKVALVTGAGSGIGRATVHRFAAEGARIVAADLDADRAQETCAGIEHAIAVGADVCSEDDAARMVATALDAFGGLDVFHNNAGMPETVKPIAEITREEWDAVIDAKAVTPAMHERGGGTILVTASIIARRPRAGLAAYVASKAGVIGLARALALELAPDVRVNVINPGPARTPMLGAFGFDESAGEALPLGRLIEPEDIAGAAAYLASDDARAITGAVFNVDGGRDL
jgi:3-oxoacyl-[acyl-carrier protein] reductase